MQNISAPVFSHQSYLAPDQAFHFARVTLGTAAPSTEHDQDYFEAFWVEAGRVRHHLGSASHLVQPGTVVFVRPGDRHALQGPARLINVLVLPQTVNHLGARYAELRGRAFWHEGPDPDTLALDPAQQRALERATEALERGPRSLMALEGFLLHLFTRIATPLRALPPDAPDWLAAALRRLAEPDYFREGAAGLARAAGRTHPHVARAMRKYLDTTPTDYVNGLRMDYAERRLAGSGDNVTEIALDCGFDSPSQFHRLFKARHGLAPHQWRRRHRRDPVQPG